MIPLKILSKFSYVFDKNLIDEITIHGRLIRFNKNDIIIDIGQKLEFVPILIHGNIKVLREDAEGNELLLYVLESGDTCAMSLTCCMTNKRSKVMAIAEKTSEVIMIPISKMQQWFNSNESWRNFILQSYQTRFDEMLETIDSLAFLKMDDRLYKYLTDQVKINASETIFTTHQEIAEDLNTSRVVISRLLKQLEKENKLRLSRNKIEVLSF